MDYRVGLVIGHSITSQGAVSKSGASEFMFNRRLVNHIASDLAIIPSITPIVLYRGLYKELPTDINMSNVDIAIEFHCNAFNEKIGGTEMLYFKPSLLGRLLAATLLKEVVTAIGTKGRGVRGKGIADRGGHILSQTNVPCVIAESFFIDSEEDIVLVQKNYDSLIRAYVTGIQNYIIKQTEGNS